MSIPCMPSLCLCVVLLCQLCTWQMAASFSSRLSRSCCSSKSLSLNFSSSSRIMLSYSSGGAGERPHDPLSDSGWPVLLLDEERPLSEFVWPCPPVGRVDSVLVGSPSLCTKLQAVLLYVGRLESELRPESDMLQVWLLRALRPLLYKLCFSVHSIPVPPGSKRLRLPWLSDRLPPGLGERYCTELRFLGTTGLKAVGLITTFSIFCKQKSREGISAWPKSSGYFFMVHKRLV